MRNILYLIAVVAIIAWAVGFFVLSLDNYIHILLGIGAVAVIIKLIGEE